MLCVDGFLVNNAYDIGSGNFGHLAKSDFADT